MPPLPEPLNQAFLAAAAPAGAGKRERTQAQLVQAAVKVFAARGVAAATVQEIAQVAGVTTGTVYNNFATKEALLQQVALTLAHTLCRAIAHSHAHVKEGAERMAIGQRRYIWLAQAAPAWALMLLDVAVSAPELLAQVHQYALEDLRLGVRQKSFKVPSEEAALELISGPCIQAMHRTALGLAPPQHDVSVATLVLRGLGMPPQEAAEVARRPLPPLSLPAPGSAEPRAGR